jgi:hypothetical protein
MADVMTSEMTGDANESADPVLEALWKRVVDAWDDDKAHAALLEHALRAERLPDLAGRYRALKDDPEKGARAQKKLDGIVVAATQTLFAMKTPARTKVPWQVTLAALIVSVALLIWLARLLLLPR